MTIKAGDLVMVVRLATCCDEGHLLGRIHRVTALSDRYRCEVCRDILLEPFAVVDGERWGYEIRQLKRIDPLSEPTEHTRETEAV